MNTEDLSDLPDWEDDLSLTQSAGMAFPDATRVACKALYKQWQEVVFLLKGILMPVLEGDDYEDSLLRDIAHHMLGDALRIGSKIKSSEAGRIYILRMENAAFVRMAAQGIATALMMFSEEQSVDKTHIRIVRNEIDTFRQMFIRWVRTFERDGIRDEWGLFA